VFPQILDAVILTQFGERRIGAGMLLDACMVQHQVEVQPPARAIVGRADRSGVVDVLGRLLLRGGEGRGGGWRAVPRQRIGHADP